MTLDHEPGVHVEKPEYEGGQFNVRELEKAFHQAQRRQQKYPYPYQPDPASAPKAGFIKVSMTTTTNQTAFKPASPQTTYRWSEALESQIEGFTALTETEAKKKKRKKKPRPKPRYP